MRASRRLLIALAAAAALASVPGHAQIYKWADERGVIHYSDQRPADSAAAARTAIVEDRVSVYTPDTALMQAVEAARREAARPAASAPAAYAPAPPWYPAPASAASADPCAGERAVFCYGGYVVHYPVALARRARRIPQIELAPGVTAGQVVGASGFIPGNSAAAASRLPAGAPDWYSTTGGFTRR